MKILRSYLAVPPSPGGMEKHVHELSVRQRAGGLDIVLVYSVGDSGDARDVRVLQRWSILHMRPQWLRDLLFYTAAMLAALRQRIHADVLHVHGDWSAFLFGRMLGWAAGAKLRVCSMHGSIATAGSRKWLYQRVCRGYALAYATGHREAELLSQWTGRRWWWITSGVQEVFATVVAAERRHDVLSVGSLVPVKNLPLLLDVAALLPHRSFRIVGGGPLLETLIAAARTRGLENVSFAGHVDLPELTHEYAMAGMFMLTSLNEGTPTAVLEAMSAGLPVVVTPCNDFGGVVIAEEGGFVSSGWNAPELAQLIERTLSDPLRHRHMAEFNRAHAKQFQWSVVAARVSSLMQAAGTTT